MKQHSSTMKAAKPGCSPTCRCARRSHTPIPAGRERLSWEEKKRKMRSHTHGEGGIERMSEKRDKGTEAENCRR